VNTRRSILLSLFLLVLPGCAIGNRFDYSGVRAPVPSTNQKKTVAVAAIDRRDDLLTKEVLCNYVGMTRDGWGIPFRAYTKSGAPLSEDIAVSFAGSLENAGYRTSSLKGFPVSDESAARSELSASKADRLMLITVRKWESDTLVHTEITTDINVKVFDRSGKLLAEENDRETRELGGNFFVPYYHARVSLMKEASGIFSRILSKPAVSKAL
jgi:hypothetical protein